MGAWDIWMRSNDTAQDAICVLNEFFEANLKGKTNSRRTILGFISTEAAFQHVINDAESTWDPDGGDSLPEDVHAEIVLGVAEELCERGWNISAFKGTIQHCIDYARSKEQLSRWKNPEARKAALDIFEQEINREPPPSKRAEGWTLLVRSMRFSWKYKLFEILDCLLDESEEGNFEGLWGKYGISPEEKIIILGKYQEYFDEKMRREDAKRAKEDK